MKRGAGTPVAVDVRGERKLEQTKRCARSLFRRKSLALQVVAASGQLFR